MSTNAAKSRPLALMLIAGCFAGSALVRIGDVGPAFAEQIAVGVESDTGCAPQAGEDELLKAIRDRGEQLDKREQQLEDRLAILEIAEERFKKQRQELVVAEERLAATLAKADGAAERDIVQLTAIYENLKPKRAASIFDTMDPEFAAGVLARMTPQTAAGILSLMDADKAYAISVILAARNMNAGIAPRG